MRINRLMTGILCLTGFMALNAQEAPVGASEKATSQEQKAIDGIKGKINGKIVWSSSRSGSKHDIWIMNADGTDPKQLTNSPNNVDWFSRFSPNGSQVIFCRTKSGWVNEMDAESFDRWDLWTINADGSDEKKVAENATWGTFKSADEIIFARGPAVFNKVLSTGAETEIFNAETFFQKKKVYCQQPQLSANGKLLAITIRGTMRETGIYNIEKKVWNNTGAGCQITWFPDNASVIRMNEGQGNGGTEVLRIKIDADGKPLTSMKGLAIPKELRFMDIPGRRSHEYFPKIDNSGKWMVWCATQYGHEHDIVDYEVYVWDVNTDKNKDPVRLTFHTGNDRWPDLFTE